MNKTSILLRGAAAALCLGALCCAPAYAATASTGCVTGSAFSSLEEHAAASEPGVVHDDFLGDFYDGRIIIEYGNPQSAGAIGTFSVDNVVNALGQQGIQVTKTLADSSSDTGTYVLATITNGMSVVDAVVAAENVDGVAYAQPDYRYGLEETAATKATDTTGDATTEKTPNDPVTQVSDSSVTANQYYLYGDLSSTVGIKGANVLAAWDTVTTDHQITIAVLDTGCNLTHEDLKDNLVTEYAYDTYDECALVATSSFNGDHFGHGTHCCGIAAASANNGIGIAGSSYNAKVLPIKVFDDTTSNPGASTSDLIEAYQYLLKLVDEGKLDTLHVISMSLGGYGEGIADSAFEEQIALAREKGILTCAAGGNGSGYAPYTSNSYPGDFPEVLDVTALQPDGTNCVWSDYNECKDISAPGGSIYSTYLTNNSSYTTMSGTSMATPLVAGIAALCFAVNPEATVDEVFDAITSTADPIVDPNDSYQRWPNKTGSKGAINAASAVAVMSNAVVSTSTGASELDRTQTMDLSASVRDLDVDLDWTWSVISEGGEATIDQNGHLTAVSAGSVTVRADATYDGKDYFGIKSLTINEIEVPGAVKATQDYSDGTVITWNAANSCTGYTVYRSQQGAESYEAIAQVGAQADENGKVTYTDATGEFGIGYDYYVVPQGTMPDGSPVDGTASGSALGVRYDPALTLTDQEQVSEELINHLTVDGGSVDTVVVVNQDDGSMAIAAMGYAGALDAVVLTTDADALDEDAITSLQAINPEDVVIVGSTEAVSDNVLAQISALVPDAQVTRVSETSANITCQDLYTNAKGYWGKTAFIIANDEVLSEDDMAAASFIYNTKGCVFMAAASSGKLNIATRTDLAALAPEKVYIIGDYDAVSTDVETQLTSIGLKWQRISGESVYDTESLLAQFDMKTYGADAHAVAVTTKGNSLSLSALSLAGYLGIPLYYVDTHHEDALENAITAGSGWGVITFDGDEAMSDSEKDRIISYVADGDVEPIVWGTNIDVSKATWPAIPDQTDDGVTLTPAVTGTYQGVALVEGEDFTVEYANNNEPGTATVTITGMGDLTGTKTMTFYIRHADGWYYNHDESLSYYINDKAVTGWNTIEGKDLYFTESGILADGLVSVDGIDTLFDQGKLVQGWTGDDAVARYYVDGLLAQGFADVDGVMTLFDQGELAQGWYDGAYYVDGLTEAGWKQIDGAWYYLTDQGAATTGWKKIDSSYYYFGTDGVMATGWLKVGSTYYYLGTNGKMVTGWKKVGTAYYYFKASGAMATGWAKVNGTYYYLGTNGKMVTGWKKISGTYYYFKASGAMATGWQKVGSTWYYLGDNGKMRTGRVLIKGYYYTFTASGAWKGDKTAA